MMVYIVITRAIYLYVFIIKQQQKQRNEKKNYEFLEKKRKIINKQILLQLRILFGFFCLKVLKIKMCVCKCE